MPIGTTPLNDGNCIPNLAFGTGTALKGKDARDAVSAALHAGFRHLDTAQVYENEESVGDGLRRWLGERGAASNQVLEGQVPLGRRKREDVWVTTKFGSADKGALEELKESLKKVRPHPPCPSSQWTVFL
jgi:diketogulonate reductase-like aldo/keto reductase